jgi:hypothetical protein
LPLIVLGQFKVGHFKISPFSSVVF